MAHIVLKAAIFVSVGVVLAACKSGESVNTEINYSAGSHNASAPIQLTQSEQDSAARAIALISNRINVDAGVLEALLLKQDISKNNAIIRSGLATRIAAGLTGAGVKVGVVDTGIDWNNPNLTNVQQGQTLRLRDAQNYVDSTASNNLRHGTAVAQVIAGTPNDSNGSRGIAPNATLYDITYLRESSEDNAFTVSNPLDEIFKFAALHDIDILNMSYNLPSSAAAEDLEKAGRSYFVSNRRDAVAAAINGGTILVIATGNDSAVNSNNMMLALGRMPELTKGQVVAVTALNPEGTALASYANHCGQAMNFCIATVGNALPVISGTNTNATFSGTSAATPVVSGALALLREEFPEANSADLVTILFVTATDLGEQGIDSVYGRGALNMSRALAPVGELTLLTSDDIEAGGLSIGQSQLSLEGPLAAVAQSLSPLPFIVTDSFGRGYDLQAQSLITRVASKPTIASSFETKIGNGTLLLTEDNGVLWQQNNWAAGYITPGPRGVFGADYSPRSLLGQSALWQWQDRASLSYNSEDENWSATLGQRFGNFHLEAGYIHEEQALLGTKLPQGESETLYVSGNLHFASGHGLTWHANLLAAHSRLKEGATFLTEAELTSASFSIEAKAKLSETSLLGFGLGVPLHIVAGKLTSDLPVARASAIDGIAQGAVLREVTVTNLDASDLPLDLAVSYAQDFAQTWQAELNIVQRVLPEADTAFSVQIKHSF